MRGIARKLRAGDYLNIDEYFDLLRWATLFTLSPTDGDPSKRGIGIQLAGVTFCLAFTTHELAEKAAQELHAGGVIPVAGQEALRRVPDGNGMIIDWKSEAEVRLTPRSITELSETFRVKPIRQEATDEWLAELNERFARDGIPTPERALRAMATWNEQNGFQVLPASRRARRIAAFFECHSPKPDETRARYEIGWRREYDAERYLGSLTTEQLQARFTDIEQNRQFTDRPVLPHEFTELEWAELSYHVRIEAERRGLTASRGEITEATPWPRAAAAREALHRDGGRPGQLFRFSNREHLLPLLNHGIMKLFPATTYRDDPSLQKAQRDDELSRTILLDPKTVRLEHLAADGTRRPLTPSAAIAVSTVSRTNYYVWCATTRIDPRLFDDFRYDACLVITDAEEFTTRFYAATAIALPEWIGAERLVDYLDPVREAADRVLDRYHKDFRFAYQREYRFAWDPKAPQIASLLQPIELRLGSLTDIARLITL
jgi:hypothetical protein